MRAVAKEMLTEEANGEIAALLYSGLTISNYLMSLVSGTVTRFMSILIVTEMLNFNYRVHTKFANR